MERVSNLVHGYQNIYSGSDLQGIEVPENDSMDNQTEWGVGNDS
jgi:hypothetical protein